MSRGCWSHWDWPSASAHAYGETRKFQPTLFLKNLVGKPEKNLFGGKISVTGTGTEKRGGSTLGRIRA